MDAIPSHKLVEPAVNGSALDPDSPEFYDACQALIARSSSRRRPGVAGIVADATNEAQVASRHPGAAGNVADATNEAQVAALRDVWLRHAEERAELETLRTELTELTARYETTAKALKEASDQASQTTAKLVEAERTISDRDLAMEQLRADLQRAISDRDLAMEQLRADLQRTISDRDLAMEQLRADLTDREQQIAEQDRVIEDLQRHLLAVEEARAADAAAILESLGKYQV